MCVVVCTATTCGLDTIVLQDVLYEAPSPMQLLCPNQDPQRQSHMAWQPHDPSMDHHMHHIQGSKQVQR